MWQGFALFFVWIHRVLNELSSTQCNFWWITNTTDCFSCIILRIASVIWVSVHAAASELTLNFGWKRKTPFLSPFLCPQDNSDLMVDCGTSMITLEINLCTAQWAGFNSSDLALNGNHNTTECVGSIDTSMDPPIIRYQLPVNHSQENPCRQSLQVRKCLGEDDAELGTC